MHCGPKLMAITSLFLGAIAVGVLSLSVATDAWVYLTEMVPFDTENGTQSYRIQSRSGLWRVCTIYEIEVHCLPVYFEPDAERVEGQETSMAIIRANRVAVLFPVAALMLLIVGSILSVLGNLRQDCKTLVAAVIFILSGLAVAVGIILYISAINDEVGHRLSKKSDDKDAMFTYNYGWSFYFAGLSFLFSMLTAVTLVSLYLQRNAKTEDMIRIIPGLEDLLEVETSNENGVDHKDTPSKATIII